MSASSRPILFRGATILTMDDALGDFAGADLLVEGGRIAAVRSEIEAPEAEVIDAAGTLLTPGFVDAHRHAWQGALRHLMPNVATLDAYVEDTHIALGPHYRPEDHHIGNLATALSALDAGTTTLVDASHNARSPAHTDACLDALESAGIRALHMPGRPLAGDWARHWPDDLLRLKAERFASEDGPLTLGLFCQPDAEIFDFAARNGLRTLTEFLGPMSPMLEPLADRIGPSNIFNHCTTLTPEAWTIVADRGASVTVDPRSDAQYGLAGGICAFQDARDHGLAPGLGSDLETAYGGDMMTEMRVAFALQRGIAQSLHYRDAPAPEPVTVQEILRAATLDGARAAGLDRRTGSLTPGKEADLLMIRADGISMLGSNNAYGAVVHGLDRSQIDAVMVAGRFRKRGGRLVDVDAAAVRRAAEASAEHLFAAVGHVPDRLAGRFGPLSAAPGWDGRV